MQEPWRCSVLLVGLLFVAPLGASLPGWQMFQADALNNGLAPTTTPYQVYKEVWWQDQAPDAALIEAGIVVPADRDIVIVADRSGLVRALNASYGTEIWNHTMGAAVVATPVISSGMVLVVDIAGTLKMLLLETGKETSKIAVGATHGTPTVHDGKLFIGNDAGVMQAFKVSEPPIRLAWSFDTSKVTQTFTGNGTAGNPHVCGTAEHPARAIEGAPAVYDNKVIFGSENHWVYAVDEHGTGGTKTTLGQTTALQWIFKTGDLVTAAPTIDIRNSRAVVGSWDGKVYALDVTPTGSGGNPCFGKINTADWTFTIPRDEIDSRVDASPAIDKDRAFVGAMNGRVIAIDVDDGIKKWEHKYGASIQSSPAIANGTLVIADSNGTVRWLQGLHGTNATLKKSYETGTPIVAPPAIAADRMYVSTQRGLTFAFGQDAPLPMPDPVFPDLVIRSADAAYDGLTIVVVNEGEGAAEATILTIDHNGTFLVDLEVPPLGPGENVTLVHAMEISEYLHSFSFRLTAVTGEKEEENNVFSIDNDYVVGPDPTLEDGGVEDLFPAAGGGGVNWVLVILIVLVISVAGAAVAYVQRKQREPKEPEE